jgi:putative aldouronate transport system permease protein
MAQATIRKDTGFGARFREWIRPKKQAPWMEEPHFLMIVGKTILLLVIAFSMLFPFVNVVAVSFSSYTDVLTGGLILFPRNPTLEAYEVVFRDG